MQRIGIMQGRLLPPQGGHFQSFPREGWATEFASAAQAGLDAIEWIYDVYGEDVNPLTSDEGISQIKSHSLRHGVEVRSLCADYFMDRPLIRATPAEKCDREQHLLWVIGRCHLAGITRIVLPFVDNSRLDTPEEISEAASLLNRVAPVADRHALELHIESSLSPEAFGALLFRVPFSNVKVNYDIGNSASLGYNFEDESTAYGQRIGSVHVKDRILGGGTVPLGTGHADIPQVFAGLEALGYSGDFILQVARTTAGNEVQWARGNVAFVNQFLKRVPSAIDANHS